MVPAVSVEAAEDSHPVRLIDYAELLDDTEYTELESKLDRISEEYDCDVAVITEDSIDGEDEVAYADDFFDYNDYGMGEDKSGVLFLITMSERKWCISTHGAAIDIFTDRGQEYISGEIKPSLSAGDYYEAFDTFADLCEQFIIQAESGEPYDVDNMPGGIHVIGCLDSCFPGDRTGDLADHHRSDAWTDEVRAQKTGRCGLYAERQPAHYQKK